MLHAITNQDYAGQLRGISPLSVCVQDIENILDYTLSQIEKAKNQSNIVFTVRNSGDKPSADPWAVLQKGASFIPPSGVGMENPAGGGEAGAGESASPEYTRVPRTEISRPGSVGVFSLPGKQELIPFTDSAPSAQFNTFVDSYFTYIAAACGHSVENVLMKFGQNYSASRAALELEHRIDTQRRWELDYYILGPIYEAWLAEEVAAGRVKAPGFADPRLRAAWINHTYSGSAMINLDPEKEARYQKEKIEIGSTSPRKAAQDLGDMDFEANVEQSREDLVKLRGIGPMPWNAGKAETAPSGENNGTEGGKKDE
jgi:capsid protein